MARITANFAVNLAQIDLNALADGTPSLLGAFTSAQGFNYDSGVRLAVADSPPFYADFRGIGITTSGTTVTGGTTTGFLTEVFNGSAYVPWYAVEGFSVGAVAVYNAVVSLSTADDMAILQSVLAGADTFNLSNQADAAAGFAGNDTLRGNAGNDTLGGGDGNDSIDGGTGNDRLTGGAGNDILNGGLGADALLGGTGNDAYAVDNPGDVVTEAAASGTDTVRSAIGFTLGVNVENLGLIGVAAINGAGNALANTITGNAAANVLAGGAGNDTLNGGGGNDVLAGGLGNDRLTAGAGLDTFRFATTPSATANVDRVLDFVSADDRIQLENGVFTALGAATGLLAATKFHVGAAAADASDRIVYNQATGAMYYDADGTGAGAQILFAQFNAGTVIHLNDLWVI